MGGGVIESLGEKIKSGRFFCDFLAQVQHARTDRYVKIVAAGSPEYQ